jgi:ubiquinone/menaquinone biosynthesis C-methylase UbiE
MYAPTQPCDQALLPFGLDLLGPQERFEMEVQQGFLNGLKGFWRDDVYAEVKLQAERLVNFPAAAIETRMQDSDAYLLYAWLERRMQQFKYRGRWGLETIADRHKAEINRLLPEGPDATGAESRVPGYVKDIDVHQHPGGLWSDAANAVAHEWYQSGASFSGVSTDVMVDHYVETVAKLLALPHGRVLDIGCTLGRMTLALKKALPEAYVEGIDVCEPAIRLARAKALRSDLEVTFRQANAEAVPHPEASFDVVGAHWLFHELPKAAIGATLDEMRRLTKPGGAIVIFDMQHVPGGAVGLWLHEGYAIRNNEPYAVGYAGMDMHVELLARSFSDVQMWDFDPATGSTGWLETLPAKRTHYSTVITARVPDIHGR